MSFLTDRVTVVACKKHHLFPPLVIFVGGVCFSAHFVFCGGFSFDILPANNGNSEVFCIHDQRESAKYNADEKT